MRSLAVVIIVFVMILLCAYQRSRTTRLGYETAYIEKQKHTLTSQIARVQVEIGALRSPPRIARKVNEMKLDLRSPEGLFEEIQKRQRQEAAATVVVFNGR